MNTRNANTKRKLAYCEHTLPSVEDGLYVDGTLPNDMSAPHEIELCALERIVCGSPSLTDVMTVELLAMRCFDAGRTEDLSTCPGFCATAIAGFRAWVIS
ncbi:hypothetical protein [Adlercreutzia sp. ZJ304]|uniref:hypothetical protein n=1 Tax=Adlercreutzia sp. ZJ304 TaxID=2709791 RepID=UPI0013ECEA41|nr:hypothetical protein [Adlercreutzia sp. ZJ304]